MKIIKNTLYGIAAATMISVIIANDYKKNQESNNIANDRELLLKNIVNDNKKFQEISSSWRPKLYTTENIRIADIQSSIDSIMYKKFLNTHIVHDSVLDEYNKIAAKNRVAKNITTFAQANDNFKEKLLKTFRINNMTNSETHPAKSLVYNQFKIDSLAYRSFFKKHKLINSNNEKFLNKIYKTLKP